MLKDNKKKLAEAKIAEIEFQNDLSKTEKDTQTSGIPAFSQVSVASGKHIADWIDNTAAVTGLTKIQL